MESKVLRPVGELDEKVQQIIDGQICAGWLIDVRKTVDLLIDLREVMDERAREVHMRFRPSVVKVKEITPKEKQDGTPSIVGLKFLGEDCLSLVGGPFTRVDVVDFNLSSRQQIGEYLQRFGWKPRKFTPTGQPVVSETELESIDIPEAHLIAEYMTAQKRVAMAQSWLDLMDENDRVHGKVDPLGAVTTRMTHMEPNVAQVTAKGKPYGARMRECWIVKPGYKLVGCDADGLELRMLAHYMNDDAYIDTVCNGSKEDGTDVHSVNQRAAGLPTRDNAKTFIYAYLYGAGDAKIGSIIGQSRKAGKELKARFLKGLPALKALRERVEGAARRGWLKGLDGRRLSVRHGHAALNTLLQGGGAIVMKEAMVVLDELATAAALDFQLVGSIHDELQYEVHEDDAEAFARLAETALRIAGENLNLRCPISGTANIGDNWGETH